jgi:7-carboxy-7-deazaguanine synthase
MNSPAINSTEQTLSPTPALIAASVGGRDVLELPFWLNEIFYSIQGEGTRAGMPCVFVRLHGCKLRCAYCDTKYAIDRRESTSGAHVSAAHIDRAVRAHGCSFVEFTGGEPLEQLNTFALMEYYCNEGFTVAVETGGHVDTEACDERVIRIIDMKTPSSKMQPMNNLKNLAILRPHDEVKFVIGSREDYEWSREIVQDYEVDKRSAAVLFSPVFGQIDLQAMVGWILEDRLPVRFQVQIHKVVWHPDTRGV